MNFKKRFALILAIAGAATLTIHIINRVITITSTMNNKLKTNEGYFYDWRFGKIFYTSTGKGSPILLIHDLENTGSSHEWNKLIEDLGKTNTVYTLDLLGCGRSDKPNLTYTNFLYVQLLNDFIKDVIGEKVDIVTSGLSSSISIMSASNYKDSVDKMILINPCNIELLSTPPTTKTKLIKFIIKTPIIGTFIYNICSSKNRIEDTFITKYLSNPDVMDKEDIDIYHEASHYGGMNAKYLTASIAGGYLNTNVVHALNSIDNSIYIISSDSSSKYIEIAEMYQKIMPAVEISISKDTEKSPQLESPMELIEQIRIFLDNQL